MWRCPDSLDIGFSKVAWIENLDTRWESKLKYAICRWELFNKVEPYYLPTLFIASEYLWNISDGSGACYLYSSFKIIRDTTIRTLLENERNQGKWLYIEAGYLDWMALFKRRVSDQGVGPAGQRQSGAGAGKRFLVRFRIIVQDLKLEQNI